jgi:NAD(P)-dependent dehydrogenase (short-subunit alcohol dehydrogenase family)
VTEKKIALVTGASSGFGRVVARRLHHREYRVFGTTRSKDAIADPDVEMLTLDVRSEDSVQGCVRTVLDSEGRIDVLVNNAGTTHLSLAEETDVDEARAVFETNFFGAVRVTNAVLPAMRARKSGRIINVSSLAGLVAIPGQAFYTASKFALEGYSEALRFEVEPFGIHVSLIEPGFYRTRLHETMGLEARRFGDYDGLREALYCSIERSFAEGGDPADVGELVARISGVNAPRLRYRVGRDARWVPVLKGLLPQRAFAIGMRKRFNLRKAT